MFLGVGGQDVTVATSESTGPVSLSANSLRPPQAALAEDIVLHRVVLGSVGKPLWEFDTPAEFICGLITVVNDALVSKFTS